MSRYSHPEFRVKERIGCVKPFMVRVHSRLSTVDIWIGKGTVTTEPDAAYHNLGHSALVCTNINSDQVSFYECVRPPGFIATFTIVTPQTGKYDV